MFLVHLRFFAFYGSSTKNRLEFPQKVPELIKKRAFMADYLVHAHLSYLFFHAFAVADIKKNLHNLCRSAKIFGYVSIDNSIFRR